jgi:hypothetical protein
MKSSYYSLQLLVLSGFLLIGELQARQTLAGLNRIGFADIDSISPIGKSNLTGQEYNPNLSSSDDRSENGQDSILLNPGDIMLIWTAPGNDGYSGLAASYDIRYLPESDGPINTQQRWDRAIQLTEEPMPSHAGAEDSMLVSGLGYGASYYFCLRSMDNANNISGLSNSPLLTAQDTVSYNFVPGDANGNGVLNGLDVTFIVNYLKGVGPVPVPLLSGDCNGDCLVNGIDIIYVINYLKGFGAGPIRGECAVNNEFRNFIFDDIAFLRQFRYLA